jgi:hypothetical protein
MKNKQVKGIGAAFAFVCGVVAISAGAPERELRGKIEAFKNAADQRDAPGMQQILHKDFRVFAFIGAAAEGMAMDKTGYVGALTAGKIGGVKRSHKILSLEVRGKHATARVQMESKELKFDTYMQWIKTEGGWQLVNDLTQAVPKGK